MEQTNNNYNNTTIDNIELHNDEKKLLKIFQNKYKEDGITKMSVEELAKYDEMGSDTKVMRTALWLSDENKKLVKIKEHKKKYYKLTDRGEETLKKGFPERQVCNYIKENNLDGILIKDLGKILDKSEVSATLGHLKRKNLINIGNGGKIIFKDLNYKDVEEDTFNFIGQIIELEGQCPIEALQQFDEAQKLSPENEMKKNKLISIFEKVKKELGLNEHSELEGNISYLIKRGFITIDEKTDRDIELTEKGIDYIKNNEIEIKEEISQLTHEHIVNGTWKKCHIRPYDAKIPVEEIYPAKLHPMTIIINEVKEVLIGMGFKEVKSPIVETEFWNFDMLFEPQDHPARDMQDTFFLKYPSSGEIPQWVNEIKSLHEEGVINGEKISEGWKYKFNEEISKRTVLRTHTTVSSIKYLSSLNSEEKEKNHKIFCIDRVFRNEAIDYKHLPEFYQCEGIIMAEGVNFDNLIGMLKEFLNRLGFNKVRIRPAYFPFTEPSLEAEVYIEGKGWLELLGAGIFRPEVVRPLGIDKPVLAWGIGLSRLAMLRWGLTDIRELHRNELNWLKTVKREK